MILIAEILLFVAALSYLAAVGIPMLQAALHRRENRRLLDRLGEPAEDGAADLRSEAFAEHSVVERRLLAAGFERSPWLILPVLLLLALAVGAFAFRVFQSGAAAAVLTAVALWIVAAGVQARAAWRSRRFEERLVDAVGLMVAVLEAGENPARSLDAAATGSEDPVAGALRDISARLAASGDIRFALRPVQLGFDSEGLRLFSQTLIAQWDVGGDLAPVLRRVHQTMLERLALRMRLQSELAGARLSSILVAIMPYTLIPVFAWQRPEWLRAVLEHPLGLRFLVIAIVLQLVGFLWLRRLFRLETTT